MWCLRDGKRGHENQIDGLVTALASRRVIEAHDLPIAGDSSPWRLPHLLRRARTLPDPDLLVGAGHATHLPLVAARRWRGGRSVALMRPSLPGALFDLCVIPAHDGARDGPRVLVTRGALNNVHPGGVRTEPGLVLVGGPSRHHDWNDDAMLSQIRAIVDRDGPAWRLATSRRTPASFAGRAGQALPGEVELVAFDAVGAGWLPGELARASGVWVSEDSVSMVYEALSAGAPTGVLAVSRRGTGRVVSGLDALVASGEVTTHEQWHSGQPLTAPAEPLQEADRCAARILARWWPETP